MTVIYRWPLWTNGRYDRFYCTFVNKSNKFNKTVCCCQMIGKVLLIVWCEGGGNEGSESTGELSKIKLR